MLFSLWIGCVLPETHENGSKSACAPTLAKPGNSWFETAGWRVVGISERRIVLDEVDMSIGQVDTRVLGKLDKRYVSEEACPN